MSDEEDYDSYDDYDEDGYDDFDDEYDDEMMDDDDQEDFEVVENTSDHYSYPRSQTEKGTKTHRMIYDPLAIEDLE
ncbi:unnamed protein product [Ambrosiozyma monospora]|uniref:Unnamed protein product n=1 Tax=Ambrosiozyma monospora TaxID=43982 RepID=A0ACB5T4E0_AMBMO|nr:unnamed protein product [Ambrosiozyma monospora]